MASNCTLCGKLMTVMVRKDHCPHCNQPSRTRSLPIVLETLIRSRIKSSLTNSKPLLGFAVTSAERRALGEVFPSLTSASLFGNYGSNHIEGVDIRDLSRFPANYFCGVFSILLFDYFTEIGKALIECARVTAPGGLFLTFIGSYRLVDGELEPHVQSVIKKTESYFDYIPDDSGMVSIKVGRETFLKYMRQAGYQAEHHSIWDEASGERSDWFIGCLPAEQAIKTAKTEKPDNPSHEKTYCLPMKALHNPNQGRNRPPFMLSLRLSMPKGLPQKAEGARFAEHVYDRKNCSSTPKVILTARSAVVESKDNGESWEYLDLQGVEKRILYNCFTTDEGNHIIQCLPEKSGVNTAKETNPERATLFLFDPEWKLQAVDDEPQARWHGRASIDQAGGTIMFAEYHDNEAKYQTAYRDDYEKWRPLMKVNRVFRSRDGGRTWAVVFEGPPELIRHFHTLQADPFLTNTWWLSSGDRAEESRVWRSDDDGDSWIDVTHPDPEIALPGSYKSRRQAAFRYTDVVIQPDCLIWGADDILGNALETGPEFFQAIRSGSRVYRAAKTNPLLIEELGYVGHPIRSIVDAGPAYLLLTEANRGYFPLQPQVVAFFKDDLSRPLEVARMNNFENQASGFTYSKSSKAALNGRFFSYRNPTDVFNNIRPCVLQWDVEFNE